VKRDEVEARELSRRALLGVVLARVPDVQFHARDRRRPVKSGALAALAGSLRISPVLYTRTRTRYRDCSLIALEKSC
jgi:hypothetical protein